MDGRDIYVIGTIEELGPGAVRLGKLPVREHYWILP